MLKYTNKLSPRPASLCHTYSTFFRAVAAFCRTRLTASWGQSSGVARVKKVEGSKKGRGLVGVPGQAREREPLWGFGGIAPSGVQGQSPWSGGQVAKPPEADDISMFDLRHLL